MYLNSIKSSFYKRKGLLWEPKWPQSMADLFMGKLKEHLTELVGNHSHMKKFIEYVFTRWTGMGNIGNKIQ